uniref:Uncharacterized protein n=1 Tax=Oryza punctata TaxID=4537 RepID=A0A0E0M1L1_ORYPU
MAAEAALEPNQEFLSATTTSGGSTARSATSRARLLYDRLRVSDGCAARALHRLRRRPRRGPRRGGGSRCPCAALSRTSTATASCTRRTLCKNLLYIGDFDAWCVALCELAAVGCPGAFARCAPTRTAANCSTPAAATPASAWIYERKENEIM